MYSLPPPIWFNVIRFAASAKKRTPNFMHAKEKEKKREKRTLANGAANSPIQPTRCTALPHETLSSQKLASWALRRSTDYAGGWMGVGSGDSYRPVDGAHNDATALPASAVNSAPSNSRHSQFKSSWGKGEGEIRRRREHRHIDRTRRPLTSQIPPPHGSQAPHVLPLYAPQDKRLLLLLVAPVPPSTSLLLVLLLRRLVLLVVLDGGHGPPTHAEVGAALNVAHVRRHPCEQAHVRHVKLGRANGGERKQATTRDRTRQRQRQK